MENGLRFRFRPAFASGKLEDGPQLVAVLSLRQTLGTLDLMAIRFMKRSLTCPVQTVVDRLASGFTLEFAYSNKLSLRNSVDRNDRRDQYFQ